VSVTVVWTAGADNERSIAATAAAMKRGGLVLLPTESVYVLATDAFSRRGTAALRRAKEYAADAPLGIMVPSISTVSGITQSVPAYARDLMEAFWPGLLTVLLPAATTLTWDATGGSPVAVRMPMHPAALAVLQRVGPTAVTAAPAHSGDGVVTPADHDEFAGLDVVLDAGVSPWAEAPNPGPGLGEVRSAPSTVIDATGPSPVIRRAGALSPQALRAVCPDL
jgi:L-threonylcarbamoyladenylate synthase